MLAIVSMLCSKPAKAQQDSAYFLDWHEVDSARCVGNRSHFRWEGARLRLDAPAAGESRIQRPCALLGEWQFSFQITLDFNPSSANHLVLRCRTNSASYLELRIGANQDELALFGIDATGEKFLCASPDGILDQGQNHLFIEVAQDAQKRYRLRWVALPGNSAWGEVRSAPDSLMPPIAHLEWLAHYTATRRDKFSWSSLWVSTSRGMPWNLPTDWRWTEVLSNPAPLIAGVSPTEDFLEGELLGLGPTLMADWTLKVNQRDYSLPPIWLQVGQPVVIGPESLRSILPPTAMLWPAELDLPGEAEIQLEHSGGGLLGEWAYSQTWHRPADKAQGGYSLEPSHQAQACLPATWHSNSEISGTSIGHFPKGEMRPIALNYPALRAQVDSLGRPTLYVAWKHPLNPQTLPSNSDGEWHHERPGYSTWRPFLPPLPGEVCTILLPSQWTTCSGEVWGFDSLRWGWPRIPAPGELQWTELLADPLPYEPRFIELYNSTEEVLDVGALFVADAPWPTEWKRLGSLGEFIMPGEVWAYSEDPQLSKKRYPAGDSGQIRPLVDHLWSIKVGDYVGLFRSDGLEITHMEGMEHAGALGSQWEGLSWSRNAEGDWLTSGDSASPGRWQPFARTNSGNGRVDLLQPDWSLLLRPQVAFKFREEGAWQLRERWLHIRGDGWTAWSAAVVRPSEGTWTSALPPPPGREWMWELEWTSPTGGIRRRAFMLKMRE